MMRRIPLELAVGVITGRLGFHLRERGLLDSALNRPVLRVYGQPVHPDIPTAAAAQTEAIIRSHPLIDGNKRTSLVLLSVFLELNGYRHTMSTEVSYELIMGLAEGRTDLNAAANVLSEQIQENKSEQIQESKS